jgi:hypothetical protein
MNRKRLAQILPTVVGIGFCLIGAMKVVFQFSATDVKDPASGHVQPIRFAPVISSDWDYITTPQMIALSVVMVAVMLLAAVMLTSKWWVRSGAPEGESGCSSLEIVSRTISRPLADAPHGPAKATVHSDSVWTPSTSEAPEHATARTPAPPPGRPTFGRARH